MIKNSSERLDKHKDRMWEMLTYMCDRGENRTAL